MDDIFVLEEKVFVTWLIDGYKLGYLNKTLKKKKEDEQEEKDILTGTKMELPLWLALELAKRNFVEIEIPR
jgi:hypothetical protein